MQKKTEGNLYDKLSNLEAEQIVLGCLLSDNELMTKMLGLEPKHFYFRPHNRIFKFIKERVTEGKLATAVTIQPNFKDDEALKAVEGGKYIAKLVGYAAAVMQPERYAEEVIDFYNKRKLLHLIEQAKDELVKDESVCVDELQTGLCTKIMSLDISENSLRSYSFQQVNRSVIEEQEKPLEKCSTGIAILDECYLGGLYPSRCYALAAKAKAGKTMMMTSLFYNIATRGIPVLYICLEMGRVQTQHRLLAREMGCSSEDFIERHGDGEFVGSLFDACSKLNNSSAKYVDVSNMNMSDLKLTVDYHVKRFGIKGFFLDYLTLVKPDDDTPNLPRFYEQLCQWLAEAAKKYNIFVYYACQLHDDGSFRNTTAPKQAVDMLHILNRKDTDAWMTSKASRYTSQKSAGDKENPGLRLHTNGPHFKDYDDPADQGMLWEG